MTKISKIRFAVVTALVAIAVGLPAVTAIANAPSKSTVRFAEPTNSAIVLETVEITGTVPYVNPAPIAKKTVKVASRHAVASHVNQVVYTELEQYGRPGAEFVRRF